MQIDSKQYSTLLSRHGLHLLRKMCWADSKLGWPYWTVRLNAYTIFSTCCTGLNYETFRGEWRLMSLFSSFQTARSYLVRRFLGITSIFNHLWIKLYCAATCFGYSWKWFSLMYNLGRFNEILTNIGFKIKRLNISNIWKMIFSEYSCQAYHLICLLIIFPMFHFVHNFYRFMKFFSVT